LLAVSKPSDDLGMTANAAACRDPRVLWRRTLDGCVLLGPGGDPVRLNGPAAAVWMLLDPCRTVDDLVQALLEVWTAPAEVVARDIGSLLGELVAADLAIDARE
jgi:hypothetical protein